MRRSGGFWATAGLVALAVLAAFLAYSAMKNTEGTTPAPLSSALTTPTDDAGGTPEPSQSVTSAIAEVLAPPLLMVDTDLAFRGRAGTCRGGASLERSTDGGSAWRPLEVPVSAILDLRSTESAVEIVGADTRCRVRVWTSTNRGRSWSDPAPARDTFARLPSTTRDIITPSGLVENPCPDPNVPPLTVEPISASDGALLCFGGEVLTTADAGVTWSEGAPVAGAQALSFDGPSLGWLLVRDGSRCPAYEVQVTEDGGAEWQRAGCLGTKSNANQLQLPAVSFSTPQDGMADLAGEIFVAPDGGSAWRRAL